MRFIKLGAISLILLVVLVTAISLLLPSRVMVRRVVEIEAPKDAIFKKVSDLHEWKDWLVNRDTLPIMVTQKDGKQILTMGNTNVVINSIAPDVVNTSWTVNRGKAMPGYLSLIKHNDTSITRVQWGFEQHVGWYPWEKFASILSDKVLGPFMEQSLENLKQNVEAGK